MRINTPPLRQRRDDIPLLLKHYLAEAANELGAAAKAIDDEAMHALKAFAWPGNVRQLVNASRRLTVTAPGGVITAEDIPSDLGGSESPKRAAKEWTRVLAAWAERELHDGDAPLLDTALPEFEKTLIETAMSQTNGRRQEAAKLLGWGRNTLARKMKALQLD
jgi:two-component system nitrogen regulation response regulator GlnG